MGRAHGFGRHAKEFGLYSAENWKSIGVLKRRVISILFLRKITGGCEEDGQERGKTDGRKDSVETCVNGHHTWRLSCVGVTLCRQVRGRKVSWIGSLQVDVINKQFRD